MKNIFVRMCIVMACLLAIGGSNAYAQDVPEVTISWDVEFWAAGVNPDTGSPVIAVQNFLKSQAICNQPVQPPPIGTVVNPNTIRLDDPDNAGRQCTLSQATSSGLIMSIPVGTGYFGTAKARGATLMSVRSAASNPFNRAVIVVAPNVPAAVQLIRQ